MNAMNSTPPKASGQTPGTDPRFDTKPARPAPKRRWLATAFASAAQLQARQAAAAARAETPAPAPAATPAPAPATKARITRDEKCAAALASDCGTSPGFGLFKTVTAMRDKTGYRLQPLRGAEIPTPPRN